VIDSNKTPGSIAEKNFRFLLPTKNKILVETEELLKSSNERDGEILLDCTESSPNLFKICLFVDEDKNIYRLSDLLSFDEGFNFLESLLADAPVFDWSYQVYQGQEELSSKEQELLSKLIYGCVVNDKISLHLYEVQSDWDEEFRISPLIKTFEYRKVLFKEPQLSFDKSKLTFNVEHDFDLKKVRLIGGLYHDTQNQALFYSDEEQIREEIKSLFSADNLKFMYKSLGFTVEKDSLKSSISYESSFFDNPLDKLEKLREVFPSSVDLDYSSNIQKSKPLTLNFKTEDKSYIGLYHDSNQSDFILNKVLKLLIGVKHGMATFHGLEAAQIAIKGPKRLNEIKLLKSSGFFIALVKIILLDKEKVEIDILWENLKPYILEHLEASSKDTIETMLSDSFKDKVYDTLTSLVDLNEYCINTIDEGNVIDLNFYDALLNFVRPLITEMEIYYKESLFYMDHLEDFKFNLAQKSQETVLEMNFPFSVEVGKYMEHNICHLEREAIQSFSTGLLEAKIEVKDLGLKKGSEWFDLDPKYYFDGKEISEEEAKTFQKNSLVRYEGKLYYISEQKSPVVKWLNYFWKRSDKAENSFKAPEDAEVPEGNYRTHVLDILALKHAGLPVQGGEEWERVANEYDRVGEAVKIDLERFDGELKPFQENGVSWLVQLYRLGLGGILADDMGLGKTVQILAFLNHLKNTEGKKRILVIVPTSLVYNWESETAKFSPHIKTASFTKDWPKNNNIDDVDILICTYGLMSEHQAFFKEIDWNIIVFDEAQQLKNIKSIRSEVARNLNADFKICLSGTPMENHYGEYYSLVDLTVPGALGDYKSFLRVYGPRKVSAGQVSQSEVDFLKLKTKPLVLRRTKSQVLTELPEKTESVVKINFDEQQKEIYKNVAMIWNSKVQSLINAQGESKTQIQMFAALMKLRQICSCPNAIEEAKYSKLSPKLSLVVDRVQELVEAGNSVLVFTNFILTLDTLKDELVKRGIAPLSITGKLTQKKREEVLTEFNTDGPKALLMTLKTGGVGLNLTKASYILHVEPWWNPAAENQGTDRAHRIGQTKNVHVYRYIMKNSIEEKIQELKQMKKEAFEGLLEKDTQNIKEGTFTGSSGLSKKDFEYLLS